jgi:hypothetical protein
VVTAAEQHLTQATRVLEAARTARPGDEFTVDGVTYQRTGKPTKFWQPHKLLIRTIGDPNTKLDAAIEEDQAFWVWAAIEVLRRTGARIEELLELTHLSLRQYHAPTGEMVPLLQIIPSHPPTSGSSPPIRNW